MQTFPTMQNLIYIVFRNEFNVEVSDPTNPVFDNMGSESQIRTTNPALQALLNQLTANFDLQFRRSVPLADFQLLNLEQAANAGTMFQPRTFLFRKMITITLADPTAANAEEVAEALQPFAKFVFIGIQDAVLPPPPVDIPPPTPDLSGFQLYWQPDPGLDFNFVRAQGINGTGINFSDCEYGWDLLHEDLMDQSITRQPDDDPANWLFIEHGTGVLGISAAGVNGYGMNGVVPNARFFVYSETRGRLDSITRAINNSRPGDIVLLEMQDFGPEGLFVPAEINPAVWDVVLAGSNKGVVIVAAAGNGGANLDSAPYDEYRSRGDSGAIIIGAGSDTTAHDRLGFSTYGSRVNVQAWGQNVATTGPGSFIFGDDPHQTYTLGFNGTSSASALSAAACAAIQSHMVTVFADTLDPLEMRSILIATGHPQGAATAATPIGPAINVRAVIERIDTDTQPPAPPANLTATVAGNMVNLAWTAAVDNVGIHEYRIFRNGVLIGTTSATNFQDITLMPGTYSYVVRAVDFRQNVSGPSNTVTVTVSSNNVTTSRRINCGDGAVGDFDADSGFTGGEVAATTATIDTSWINTPVPPQAVFQSDRNGDFTYRIGGFTPGSFHTVTCFFVETVFNTVGSRVFNVTINGLPFLTNFDIINNTQIMFRALQRDFGTTANGNGEFVIQFTSVVNRAKVDGIQIIF